MTLSITRLSLAPFSGIPATLEGYKVMVKSRIVEVANTHRSSRKPGCLDWPTVTIGCGRNSPVLLAFIHPAGSASLFSAFSLFYDLHDLLMTDFTLVDPKGWEYDLHSVCLHLLQ